MSETTVSGQLHGTDKSNRIGQYDAVDSAGNTTSTEFYHDDAGNLVLDDKNFYKYDAWNRISEAYSKFDAAGQALMHVVSGALTGTPGALIAKYEYDALGRRIAKTVGTDPTEYFYYDGHRLIEHHKDQGGGLSLFRRYVYGLNYIDEPVAYYDSDIAGSTPTFVLQDANYNVVGLVDPNGNLVQQYSYKPYGGRLFAENVSSNGSTTSIDIENNPDQLLTTKGHQGLHHMPEIDAVYNRARIYFPSIGRFGQKDSNETALLVASVLLRNAQSALASAATSASVQYAEI